MCAKIGRKWRTMEEEEEERKNPRITKESLRRICKEHKLYLTPHLNDVLYLHYKGYSKIENLDEYTGLKCLWLENNGIDKIENLQNQKELRCLYMHHNLIKKIENLEESCPLLDSLNLCHNSISEIKNLSKLHCLHTLHISHNRLQNFSDVEHLKDCKELSCVDLQHNWLDDPAILDIFQAMENLKVLYLTGNPVIKKIVPYRKNLTVRCTKLTYLDDRPVFPKDRAAAEAWSVGGIEAERACRQRWADEERAKIDASVKGLMSLRKRKGTLEVADMEETIEGKESEAEESENDSESDLENLEAGDSGDVGSRDEIILPWSIAGESRRTEVNEFGEAGKSLIIEIPNDDDSKIKRSRFARTCETISRESVSDDGINALAEIKSIENNIKVTVESEGNEEEKVENNYLSGGIESAQETFIEGNEETQGNESNSDLTREEGKSKICEDGESEENNACTSELQKIGRGVCLSEETDLEKLAHVKRLDLVEEKTEEEPKLKRFCVKGDSIKNSESPKFDEGMAHEEFTYASDLMKSTLTDMLNAIISRALKIVNSRSEETTDEIEITKVTENETSNHFSGANLVYTIAEDPHFVGKESEEFKIQCVERDKGNSEEFHTVTDSMKVREADKFSPVISGNLGSTIELQIATEDDEREPLENGN